MRLSTRRRQPSLSRSTAAVAAQALLPPAPFAPSPPLAHPLGHVLWCFPFGRGHGSRGAPCSDEDRGGRHACEISVCVVGGLQLLASDHTRVCACVQKEAKEEKKTVKGRRGRAGAQTSLWGWVYKPRVCAPHSATTATHHVQRRCCCRALTHQRAVQYPRTTVCACLCAPPALSLPLSCPSFTTHCLWLHLPALTSPSHRPPPHRFRSCCCHPPLLLSTLSCCAHPLCGSRSVYLRACHRCTRHHRRLFPSTTS